MMLILVALLMSVCSGAQLDNRYLPPSNAVHSGGDGSILGAPLHDRSQGLGPDSVPRSQYGTPSQQQYAPQLISSQGKPQTTPSRLYGSPQQPTSNQQQSAHPGTGVSSENEALSSRFGSPGQKQPSSYSQDTFSQGKPQTTPSRLYGSPQQPTSDRQQSVHPGTRVSSENEALSSRFGSPGQKQPSSYSQDTFSQGKPQTTPSRLYGSPQQPTSDRQQSVHPGTRVSSENEAFPSRFGSPGQKQPSSYSQDTFSQQKPQTPSQLYGSPAKFGQTQNEYSNVKTFPGQQSLSPRFGSSVDSSFAQPQSFSGSRLSQKTPSQVNGSPVETIPGKTANQFSRTGSFGSQKPSQLYGAPETQSRFGQEEQPFTSARPQQSTLNVASDAHQQFSGPQTKQQFGQTLQTSVPKQSTPFGTSDIRGTSDTPVSGFGPDSRSNQFKTTTGQNVPQYSNQAQGQAYPNLQQKNYQAPKAFERPDDSERHLESRFGPSHTPTAHRPEQDAVILRQNSEVNFDGTYAFDFETSDGTAREENGHPDYTESEEGDEVVSGSYRYTAPSGEIFTVDYIADKDGFRPTGDHLPTSPPIPDAILRSLEQNAATDALDGRARDNFSPQSQQYTPGQYQTDDQNVKLGSRFGPNQQFVSPQTRPSFSSESHPQQSSLSKTNLPDQGYTSRIPSYEQPQQPGQPKIQSQGFDALSRQSIQTPNLQSRFSNQQPSSSFSSPDQSRGYPSGSAKNVGAFDNEPQDISGKHPNQKYPSSGQTYPTSAQTPTSSRFGNQQDKSAKYSPESVSAQGRDYQSSISGRPFDSQGLKPRFGNQQTGKTSYPSDDEFSGYPSGPAKSNIKPTGINTEQYPSAGQSYPGSGSRYQYSPASRLSQDNENYPEAGAPGQLSSRFGSQKPSDSLFKPNKKPTDQSSGIVRPDISSTLIRPGQSEENNRGIEPRNQQRPNVFGIIQKQGPKAGTPTSGFNGYPSSEETNRYSSAPSQGFKGPSIGTTKLQDRFDGSKTPPQQAFDPETGYMY